MANERFMVEVLETRTRGNHFTLLCKFNERFDGFIIKVKTNDKIDWRIIKEKIEEVKIEINNKIDEGYLRRRIDLEYKF